MSRRRRFDLPRRLAQMPLLERYGLLALAGGLFLAIAWFVQVVTAQTSPGGPLEPLVGDVLAEARPQVALAADEADPEPEPESEPPRIDAPGGGEVERPRHGRRPDFDFFEPPVRLPGRPPVLAPPPPGSKSAKRTTKVVAGDTLQKIAARELGDASRWRLLLECNPGLDPKRLQAGRELILPELRRAAPETTPPPAKIYEVKRDDTLQSIAQKLLGDRDRFLELLEANRDQLDGPASLRAGMKLRIP